MSECLHFLDGAIIDGYIYFSASDFNGLYRWNLASYNTEFLSFFPDEYVYGQNIYGHVIRYKNNIIFLPIHGKRICIYDTQNGDIESITIDDSNAESVPIAAYITLQEKYLLIPADLKKDFFYFYTEDRRVERASQISDKVSFLVYNEDTAICRYYGACSFKDKIIISVVNKNYVLEINIASGETKKIPINTFRANNMYSVREYMWLISYNGKEVIKWYSDEKKYVRYTFADAEEQAFFSIVPYKDTFLLLPCRGNEVKKYDKEKDIWETFIRLDNESTQENAKGTQTKYCGWGTWGNYYYLYPAFGSKMIIINMENDHVEMVQLSLNIDYDILKKENLRRQINRYKCLYESVQEGISLDKFLNYIVEEMKENQKLI